ncbi:glycerophosphodiester phosphodiesterase [Ascidiimonas sp. W6]|uniref:glycerophosphodiester phosphodiesterase n=1 Tax=Ascidiimonas meishanensis TaxID=3128903 RepID=UPI0030EEA845
MIVIGHRGAMGYETENTLASIQKALDFEVDAIEIDVFRIKSGEIVVFHDDTVDRLTNGTGSIEEMNIIEVKNLQLIGGHQIPLLQEVLKLIDGKCKLNIELKGKKTAGKVQHIVSYYMDKKGWNKEDFIISSFEWDELRDFRSLDQQMAIAVLTEDDPLKALAVAEELKAVAINPYYKNIDAETVNQIHNKGYKVYPWTVNEEVDIKKMKEIAVDGIFTNFPDRALNN